MATSIRSSKSIFPASLTHSLPAKKKSSTPKVASTASKLAKPPPKPAALLSPTKPRKKALKKPPKLKASRSRKISPKQRNLYQAKISAKKQVRRFLFSTACNLVVKSQRKTLLAIRSQNLKQARNSRPELIADALHRAGYTEVGRVRSSRIYFVQAICIVRREIRPRHQRQLHTQPRSSAPAVAPSPRASAKF